MIPSLLLLFAGTAGLLLIALWQALTFHLNKQTHKIFVDEVDRLKANGLKQNVTPEARRIVEDLTGYDYDQLWCDIPAEKRRPSRHLRRKVKQTCVIASVKNKKMPDLSHNIVFLSYQSPVN
ncbi:Uncharacterised protein [Raoultella terrigena]|uniref:Uncharacterized protein n=1 Tax=Raoultella terrigena TaxID=577 RepID=A0A4U9CX24_RAOTE|nr:Uncharacterised protein [Raoultella terrigena]